MSSNNGTRTPQNGGLTSPRRASVNIPLERVNSEPQRALEREDSAIGSKCASCSDIKPAPALHNLDGCACISTDEEEQFVYPDDRGGFFPRERTNMKQNKTTKTISTKQENIPLSLRPARIADEEIQRRAQREARLRAAQLDREVRESQQLPASRVAAAPVQVEVRRSHSVGGGGEGCCMLM